jgi:hypothetical protein
MRSRTAVILSSSRRAALALATARSMAASSSSSFTGLVRKSIAPPFMAFTLARTSR